MNKIIILVWSNFTQFFRLLIFLFCIFLNFITLRYVLNDQIVYLIFLFSEMVQGFDKILHSFCMIVQGQIAFSQPIWRICINLLSQIMCRAYDQCFFIVIDRFVIILIALVDETNISKNYRTVKTIFTFLFFDNIKSLFEIFKAANKITF